MDRISGLPDELLTKILSFLPTKVAVSTSVLSKRWESLWMWVPKLDFGSRDTSEYGFHRLQCFLHRKLTLHKAPVLESFRLQLSLSNIKSDYVRWWIIFAVFREVRELEISYPDDRLPTLPSQLYTCKFLVTLILHEGTFVNVPPEISLPCLKTLRLEDVCYDEDDSLQRLLSCCPVLEDLEVVGSDRMEKLTVMVPTLKRLSLYIDEDLIELVIITPSLKYLKFVFVYEKDLKVSFKNMPILREAVYMVSFPFVKRLIGAISVELLTLCLKFFNGSEVQALYDDGFVFNHLEHLKLCMCHYKWEDSLFQLLKISPNLRVLELFTMDHHSQSVISNWSQPITVPECMCSSLQTFKWLGYYGSKEESELACYILQNASCLKTATF